MTADRYSVRVLKEDEKHLCEDMARIDSRTQFSPWPVDELASSFCSTYINLGLFDYETLIGFSMIYNTKISTDIMTIGVDPDYQGKKLGYRLLHETLKTAFDNGAYECFLEVRVSNSVAINLYKKLGFKTVGVRKGYYNPEGDRPAEDAYTMHLESIEEALKI